MNLRFKLKVESCRLSVAGTGSTCDFQPATFNHRSRALTLLEMMVAVTLLAVIMIGLLAMFQYTQRALHIAHTQTDVFENARGAIQLVARDLSEMTDYGATNVINAYSRYAVSPVPGGVLQLTSTNLPIDFAEAFWLARVNDDWQGIGYYVDGTNFGAGTLYRFSETVRYELAPAMIGSFTATPVVKTNIGHRVSAGVVHFSMEAVYIYRDPTSSAGKEQYIRLKDFTFPINSTNHLTLPVFVDVEIGILEPATLKQFNSLTGNVVVAQNFLRDHVGRIHFFRERVPIHNFINPYRENELQ